MSGAQTRALIEELVALLARGLTDAGHAAQIVQNEHRGNCTVRGCTPLCQRYGAALDAARAWLEGQPTEVERNAGPLFGAPVAVTGAAQLPLFGEETAG